MGSQSFVGSGVFVYTGYYGEDDLVGKVNQNQVLQGLEDIIASGLYDWWDMMTVMV